MKPYEYGPNRSGFDLRHSPDKLKRIDETRGRPYVGRRRNTGAYSKQNGSGTGMTGRTTEITFNKPTITNRTDDLETVESKAALEARNYQTKTTRNVERMGAA